MEIQPRAFVHARAAGEPVLLMEQNRTLWDRLLIHRDCCAGARRALVRHVDRTAAGGDRACQKLSEPARDSASRAAAPVANWPPRLAVSTPHGRVRAGAPTLESRMCTQSVRRVAPGGAAIAACSRYGPRASPAPRRAPAQQSAMNEQPVQSVRFCSMSRTGSPRGPRRARMREAWISISATSP